MQHLLQRSPDRAFRDKTGIRLPKQSIKPPPSPFSPLTYKAWNEELSAPSSPEAYKLLHKFKHLKTEPPLGAEGWQPEDFLRYMLHCTHYICRFHLPLYLAIKHPDPPSFFFPVPQPPLKTIPLPIFTPARLSLPAQQQRTLSPAA